MAAKPLSGWHLRRHRRCTGRGLGSRRPRGGSCHRRGGGQRRTSGPDHGLFLGEPCRSFRRCYASRTGHGCQRQHRFVMDCRSYYKSRREALSKGCYAQRSSGDGHNLTKRLRVLRSMTREVLYALNYGSSVGTTPARPARSSSIAAIKPIQKSALPFMSPLLHTDQGWLGWRAESLLPNTAR